MHRFGAHAGVEFIAVFFDGVEVLLVGQQLAALQLGHAGIDHHKGFEVQHPLDIAQGHVQQQADARRQGLQEPDMRHRAGQLDVAHALTAHLGQGDFHAAFFADHAAMFQTLVFAAQALVVLDRPEDLGAEQAVALGLEGTVVDGFRLFHFAERPGADLVRRRQADADGVEFFDLSLLLQHVK